MSTTGNIAHQLMKFLTAKDHSRFINNAGNASAIQEQYLLSLLQRNAYTRFGRKHYFSKIRNIDEFRDKVPLTSYDDYQPYIDEIAAGGKGVLTASKVLKLVPTSGTTGFNKFIPYTNDTITEFNLALNTWMHDLYLQYPLLAKGRAFWILSPVGDVPEIESVVPAGFENDDSYFGNAGSRIINATMVLPPQLKQLRDPLAHMNAMCLHMLAAADLNLISVWNPTYLVVILRYITEHREKLLHEMYRGNSPVRINRNRRKWLQSALTDNLFSTPWKEVWPHLQLISCWTHGWAASQVPAIHHLFENIPIQGKGLLATEGAVTIPFMEYHLPAYYSHFLEFSAEDGRIYLPGELEMGKTYESIITTGSGLYRYGLNDQVRVTAFHLGLPSLEFTGKSNVVSDLVGEKLSEPVACKILETLRREFEITPLLFFLAPSTINDLFFYTLYTDYDSLPVQVALRLDQELKQVFSYEQARNLNQLAPPVIYQIEPGNAENYLASLSPGQQGVVKQLSLTRQINLFEKLKGQFKT